MISRTLLAVLVTTALAAGCSDDDTDDVGTTSTGAGGSAGTGGSAGSAGAGQSGSSGQSGTGGGGAAGQGGGVCVQEFKASGMNEPPSYTPWGCAMTSLCAKVVFAPTPDGQPTGIPDKELKYELAPDATTCLLEALRDGKTGKLSVAWTNGQQADLGSNIEQDIFALGDGTVLYESRESLGCCGLLTVFKSGRLVLRDKAYFDDCIARAPGAARAQCVLGFSEVANSKDDGTPPWTTGSCDSKAAACP